MEWNPMTTIKVGSLEIEVDESPLFEAAKRIQEIINAPSTDPEEVRQMLLDIREAANDAIMARQANYQKALTDAANPPVV